MRISVSIAFTAATLVSACAPESARSPNDESGSIASPAAPHRDLTLQAPVAAPEVVASAVELGRPPVKAKRAPRPRPARPALAAIPAEEAPPAPVAPAIVSVMTEAATAEPPVEDMDAGAGRELAPGKTVTIIPASTGSATVPEEPEWGPVAGRTRGVMVGGGGPRCRPRGGVRGGVRGIGIAGRIPVGIPSRRLR
jgi:hypothetical protein